MQALFLSFSQLFADVLLDDLTQVPQPDNTLHCFFLFFLGLIVQIYGMGAAISAFYLDIPAALMNDQAVTAAAGTFFQNDILFIHINQLLI